MEKEGRIKMEYGCEKVSLLSCPFCGSDPLIHSYRWRGLNYSIRCGDEFGVCRMRPQTLNYPDLEQAAADWNMRPEEKSYTQVEPDVPSWAEHLQPRFLRTE